MLDVTRCENRVELMEQNPQIQNWNLLACSVLFVDDLTRIPRMVVSKKERAPVLYHVGFAQYYRISSEQRPTARTPVMFHKNRVSDLGIL